jgi:Replication stress response SDE2 C-terminal
LWDAIRKRRLVLFGGQVDVEEVRKEHKAAVEGVLGAMASGLADARAHAAKRGASVGGSSDRPAAVKKPRFHDLPQLSSDDSDDDSDAAGAVGEQINSSAVAAADSDSGESIQEHRPPPAAASLATVAVQGSENTTCATLEPGASQTFPAPGAASAEGPAVSAGLGSHVGETPANGVGSTRRSRSPEASGPQQTDTQASSDYGDRTDKQTDGQASASSDHGGRVADDCCGPVDLAAYASADGLQALGLERLKAELQSRGLKCGGSLAERAARLYLVKDTPLDQLDRKHFAKPSRR